MNRRPSLRLSPIRPSRSESDFTAELLCLGLQMALSSVCSGVVWTTSDELSCTST